MATDEPLSEERDGTRDPSRVLLAAGRDLELVVARHVPALRDEGLDDIAEQLEILAGVLTSNAQELAAALQD
jgi:hypothetical protein